MTPPPVPPKRPTTHVGDRGEVRRERTPPRGIGLTEPPPVEYIEEDITQKYQGKPAELAQARERRSTRERLAILEAKNDELQSKLIAEVLVTRSTSRGWITKLLIILAQVVALGGAYLIGKHA